MNRYLTYTAKLRKETMPMTASLSVTDVSGQKILTLEGIIHVVKGALVHDNDDHYLYCLKGENVSRVKRGGLKVVSTIANEDQRYAVTLMLHQKTPLGRTLRVRRKGAMVGHIYYTRMLSHVSYKGELSYEFE